MKSSTVKSDKKDKQKFHPIYWVIIAVFLSKYVYEAGIAVGKMFYRLFY